MYNIVKKIIIMMSLILLMLPISAQDYKIINTKTNEEIEMEVTTKILTEEKGGEL